MREFTLVGFAAFLGKMAIEMPRVDHEALEAAAVIVENEAKHVIGTYEYGWPPLAESTVARKGQDTPLLSAGPDAGEHIRDTIKHTVSSHEADIGSDSDIAVWQELGTSRIPPRSFLEGAATHKEKEVVYLLGEEVVAFLSSGSIKKQIS